MPVTADQKAEIDNLRESGEYTRRAVVPELEKILYEPIPLLDHGFIRVIDYMGDDSSIVQAARVSYGKGTKKISNDKGLIRYLMRHSHSTPFEMCEIKFHIKLPLFIARQWIRHRTANVNEYSARYSILDNEFYIPGREFLDEKNQGESPDLFTQNPETAGNVHQLAPQSVNNKQGRDGVLTEEEATEYVKMINETSKGSYETYEKLLNETPDGEKVDPNKQGVARELSRMVLSANIYTQWYWKIDLHNLLHFLRLRADSHAQYEIRVYAQAMLDIVKKWVPVTYDAFCDYKQDSIHLSAKGHDIIKRKLAGEAVTQEDSGLSKREWAELVEQFPF